MDATKRPWTHRPGFFGEGVRAEVIEAPHAGTGRDIAYMAKVMWEEEGSEEVKEMEANARLIVKACNLFDEMVEALKFSRSVHISQGLAVENIDALLKRAKGE